MPRPAKFRPPKNLVRRHVRALALGKSKYKESDAALSEAIETAPRCSACNTPLVHDVKVKVSGRTFRFVDKFRDKITTNVGQNARRFELEEVPAS